VFAFVISRLLQRHQFKTFSKCKHAVSLRKPNAIFRPYGIYNPISSIVQFNWLFTVHLFMVSLLINMSCCWCLQLFISQYHIWLSADTQGLLVLVPGSPHVNAIVTSFVFVCVSHEVHCITEQLLPYIVPSDWCRLARNIFIGLTVSVLFKLLTVSSPLF